MIARNERMRGEAVWFRPVIVTKRIVPGGPTHHHTIYGAPTRSEAKARACAMRLARAMISAKFEPCWNVGVGRSFNRSSTPSICVVGENGAAAIPELPPLPPLTGPSRGA